MGTNSLLDMVGTIARRGEARRATSDNNTCGRNSSHQAVFISD
jgi:hypothetical protein